MSDEAGTLWVRANPNPMSYLTNEQAHHLFVEAKSRRALCGVNAAGWPTKAHQYLGGAYLCGKCERIAQKRGSTIPK